MSFEKPSLKSIYSTADISEKKWKINSLWKIFRQINLSNFSREKLLSRNFSKTIVIVIFMHAALLWINQSKSCFHEIFEIVEFRNFHTVAESTEKATNLQMTNKFFFPAKSKTNENLSTNFVSTLSHCKMAYAVCKKIGHRRPKSVKCSNSRCLWCKMQKSISYSTFIRVCFLIY